MVMYNFTKNAPPFPGSDAYEAYLVQIVHTGVWSYSNITVSHLQIPFFFQRLHAINFVGHITVRCRDLMIAMTARKF